MLNNNDTLAIERKLNETNNKFAKNERKYVLSVSGCHFECVSHVNFFLRKSQILLNKYG